MADEVPTTKVVKFEKARQKHPPATQPVLPKGVSGETLEKRASVMGILYAKEDEALPTGTLDPAVRARFAEDAAYIRQHVGDARERILLVGKRLIAVKTKMGCHDEWRLWLRDEFKWHEQTARNYMNVARAVAKNQSLWKFSISVEALYALTTHTTPPEALQRAVEEARTGAHIGLKRANAIKRETNPP
jgi:hypothetical protein